MKTKIHNQLSDLYGEPAAAAVYERVIAVMNRYRASISSRPGSALNGQLTERDAVLIVYGDQVSEPGVSPLKTLFQFCNRFAAQTLSAIHILPFYPFTSDDGFSVIDYREVDPNLGTWKDIEQFRKAFTLMFDAVINHISSHSQWFQAFLQDDPKYKDYFIVIDEKTDLSQVVRPRALPLLTTFSTPSGPKAVWTTFSADQIDLNFHSPDVLLEIIDTLLYYVSQGAEIIRLDAIAYLWKEIGSSCIHLPQTHRAIQLFRSILNEIAPQVFLITETNVPHQENISYFGDGTNEAQLVYNFALPPLVLHTFLSGDTDAISHWADKLWLPSKQTTFFNFLASHDGIGLNPVREILSDRQIEQVIQSVQSHGGMVSYKHNPDGTQSPYELNISYFDALSDPAKAESLEVQAQRFIAAHAILFSLVGVPGIYFHSLFGSRSWQAGVDQTGRNRTINRQKLILQDLEHELTSLGSLRNVVYTQLTHLLNIRGKHPAFSPYGEQQVLNVGSGVFAVKRFSTEHPEKVDCLINVTNQDQTIHLAENDRSFWDLLTTEQVPVQPDGSLVLKSYQILWLVSDPEWITLELRQR